MAKMYLMTGPSGSGKTTFARQFAADNNFRYLGVDDFYAMFLGSPTAHTYEFEVWQSFFQSIHLAELDGVSCVIDTNSPTMVDRVQFLNWFPTFEHHLIVMSASKLLCWHNNKLRERRIPLDTFIAIYDSCKKPDSYEDDRWRSVTFIENDCNQRFILKHCIDWKCNPITFPDKIFESVERKDILS